MQPFLPSLKCLCKNNFWDSFCDVYFRYQGCPTSLPPILFKPIDQTERWSTQRCFYLDTCGWLSWQWRSLSLHVWESIHPRVGDKQKECRRQQNKRRPGECERVWRNVAALLYIVLAAFDMTLITTKNNFFLKPWLHPKELRWLCITRSSSTWYFHLISSRK